MHAVEKLDHGDQPRRDIDFVGDVGLVGVDDGNPKNGAESGGEYEQPEQGPYQGRDESFALMQKAQGFTLEDAQQAAPGVNRRHLSMSLVPDPLVRVS